MLGLLFLVTLDSAWRNSATVDEVGHPVAGIAYWERGDFFIYHHSPPLLRLLMAAPVMAAAPEMDYSRAIDSTERRVEHDVGRDFMFANAGRYHGLLMRARAVTILFTILGGWLLYRWARELYGSGGGVLALGLWSTEPLVIAHGGLATTDVASSVLGLAGAYSLWRYLQEPSRARLLGFSLLTGLGLLAKFSLLLLLPVYLVTWLLSPGGRHAAAKARLQIAGSFVLIVLLVVNLGYGCQQTFRPLGEFQFTSSGLSGKAPGSLGNRFEESLLGTLPIPVPAQYLLGLDAQRADFERGWTSYLRGKTRQYGWLHYYLYCFLVKTPPGSLVLFVLGLSLGFRKSMRRKSYEEVLLVAPIAVTYLVLSLNVGINHHYRYTLLCYPFMCLATARLGAYLAQNKNRLARAVIGGSLFLNLVGLASVHPQELAYFNNFVGGSELGHNHLADSNIDWGQDLIRLKRWQEANPQASPLGLAYHSVVDPEVYGLRYTLAPSTSAGGPRPGWYAISVNQFLGLPFVNPDGQGTLRQAPSNSFRYFQEFQPVARAGYGFFIFHLKPHQVAKVRTKLGLPALSQNP